MSELPSARRTRSSATQQAIMDAAEALFAEHGLADVSIRQIVAASNQRNESALQYHFGSKAGLLSAIHERRAQQTQERRALLLTELLDAKAQPSLREICLVMVKPAFELARADESFRRYVAAFGHELALAEGSPMSAASAAGGGGPSGRQTGELLVNALGHLDKDSLSRRLDAAVRLIASSMHHQARQKRGFMGRQAMQFLHHLVDAVEGLLSAPVSSETSAL